MATPIVLLNANVLYPAALRDLLVRLAIAGAMEARWTDTIHDEWTRNVLANRPDLSRERIERTRDLMNAAVPDCLVTGYEPLIETLSLPDPDDHHVLAAAIRSGAELILTFNARDFPTPALALHDLVIQHPDEFVLRLLDESELAVREAARRHRAALRNPPKSVDDYLATLAEAGLKQTVVRLRLFAHEL